MKIFDKLLGRGKEESSFETVKVFRLVKDSRGCMRHVLDPKIAKALEFCKVAMPDAKLFLFEDGKNGERTHQLNPVVVRMAVQLRLDGVI